MSTKAVWKVMDPCKIMLRDSFETELPIFGICYTASFILDEEHYILFHKEEYGVTNYYPKEEKTRPKVNVSICKKGESLWSSSIKTHPLLEEFPCDFKEWQGHYYEYNGEMLYKLVEAILSRGGTMVPPNQINPFDINDHGYG